MSETPRTDAKHKSLAGASYVMGYGVMLEFARRLESERVRQEYLLDKEIKKHEIARADRDALLEELKQVREELKQVRVGLELERKQKAELLATRAELDPGARKTKDCWKLIKAAFFVCEMEETVQDKSWGVYKDAFKDLRAAAHELEALANSGVERTGA